MTEVHLEPVIFVTRDNVLIAWLKEQLTNRRLETEEAPSMAARNGGVSSLLIQDVKDTTDSVYLIYGCTKITCDRSASK
jgi:hypothetical protein